MQKEDYEMLKHIKIVEQSTKIIDELLQRIPPAKRKNIYSTLTILMPIATIISADDNQIIWLRIVALVILGVLGGAGFKLAHSNTPSKNKKDYNEPNITAN